MGISADIYALALMLNEMFTGSVPHGTSYPLIANTSADNAFLDPLVSSMLANNPADRPKDIAAVKRSIEKYQSEAVSQQKISKIDNTVIREDEIDDPLAHQPPTIIDLNWDKGVLTLIFDQPISEGWRQALLNMGNYQSTLNAPPQAFRFKGNKAAVQSNGGDAQMIVNFFKSWIPLATARYRHNLNEQAQQTRLLREAALLQERETEERKLAINRSLTF